MKIFYYGVLIYFLSIFGNNLLAVNFLWETKPHNSTVNKLILSQNEKLIFSIANDKKILTIDLNTSNTIGNTNLTLHPKDVVLGYDNNTLLISSKTGDDSRIYIYDINSFSIIDSIDLQSLMDLTLPKVDRDFDECHSLPLSNNRILTGTGIYKHIGNDFFNTGSLDIWDIETDKYLNQVWKGGMITNLIQSADKKFIAFSVFYSASEYIGPHAYMETMENQLILTDTNFTSFQILRSDYKKEQDFVETEVFNSIAFSNDSKLLAAATDDHHLFIYDVNTYLMTDSIYSCDCYSDQSIDFLFDNIHLITGTNNGRIVIWSSEYNLSMDNRTIEGNPIITTIAASFNKNLYVLGDDKGNIRLLTSPYIYGGAEVETTVSPILNYYIKNDKLIVNINEQISDYQIEIFDLLGNNIYNENRFNNQAKMEIDLSDFPNGCYVFTLKNSNNISFNKFQIIH